MRILDAEFVKSATSRSHWPAPDGRPEVALCGRSNVGKSSLLNSLLGRRSLARVSRTPGRTRLLNFFSVRYAGSTARGELLLCDLPGFGYAEVGHSERVLWRKMMEEYLTERSNLQAIVLLFDGRRVLDSRAAELLFDETELVGYLKSLGRQVIPVITKADKLAKSERKPAALALGRLIGTSATIYSSVSGEGQPELLRRVLSAVRKDKGRDRLASDDQPAGRVPGEDDHEGDTV